MPKLFSSLQARIVALVILPLVVVGALVMLTYFEQRDAAAAEARDKALTLTRATVPQEEQILESARQLLVGLAALPYIQSPGAECDEHLRDLNSHLPGYALVGAASIDGTQLCSSAAAGSPPIEIGDRRYFQEAMRTGGLGVGVFQIGRVSGKRSIGLGYPIAGPDGAPAGVVFATLDLDWLNAWVVGRLSLPAPALRS